MMGVPAPIQIVQILTQKAAISLLLIPRILLGIEGKKEKTVITKGRNLNKKTDRKKGKKTEIGRDLGKINKNQEKKAETIKRIKVKNTITTETSEEESREIKKERRIKTETDTRPREKERTKSIKA